MSTIDATKPVSGIPTTASVRDNFSAAKTELEAFQLSSGSSLVGFIQSGVGAGARTVEARLRDVVSASDFPAASVTLRIDAALAEVGSTAVIVPPNLGAGNETSVPVGKMVIDYRSGKISIRTTNNKIEFRDAGMFLGKNPYGRIHATTDAGAEVLLFGIDGGVSPATFIATGGGGTIAFTDSTNNTKASFRVNGAGNVQLKLGDAASAESMLHMKGDTPLVTYEAIQANGKKWQAGEFVSGGNSYFLIYNATDGVNVLRAKRDGNDFLLGPNGQGWFMGAGSPEGVVTAPVGSLYTNRSGGAITTLYVKESGVGNTGWIAK